MEKTLSMKFIDEKGKKVNMSISEIKDDLTEEQISTLMDVILAKKAAFKLDDPLVAKDSAQIVERTVNEVYKA
ncbi:DUF2922 domain-containing protein [Clostridium cochlearium]|jgi:hypothetical protein|uniref:DUF2922 domain-containing protein n=1 Tax=Clostridium cochlearium TaxID=1494 RepID=A0A2X2W5J1_CLOCO|nr:DUF2922 domain-containing protein [Clostridium cochlearium]MBV1821423.1 DUF2922 domain-containing protein [Bacteroidales bacterium MSK.15.36]NSJ92126.1 DUF2922 domain-containing protein [Coprococcus sp. MSK.21.13]MBE6064453.1 DUF2922 domain-containing protein [Clostridium cochlearium]MCG4579822.1 DUF2922 domain-containing protein [Clostridium cochlearium]NMA57622.1 DUF2922 domain-containing protein [Clostridium cochlearium]